jgi:hypothetical protein
MTRRQVHKRTTQGTMGTGEIKNNRTTREESRRSTEEQQRRTKTSKMKGNKRKT